MRGHSLDTVLSLTAEKEPAGSVNTSRSEGTTSANGDISAPDSSDAATATIPTPATSTAIYAPTTSEAELPSSPPLTFEKFVTMQGKRVPVEMRYSTQSGLRPFFLTVAKKIKSKYPDVVVEKRILPNSAEPESSFEVLVDGKPVVGKSGTKRHARRSGDSDLAGGLSVYVSMEEIDLAVAKARRKRRPNTTVYSQNETEEMRRGIRLEVLQKKSLGRDDTAQHHWND